MKLVLYFLIACLFLLMGSVVSTMAAGERMPVPAPGWTQVLERPIGGCSSVIGRAYESSDGSTVDDQYFPMIAWFLSDRDTPFLAIQFNSVSGTMFLFWFDDDGDGVSDSDGGLPEFKQWMVDHANGSICEIVKEVE